MVNTGHQISIIMELASQLTVFSNKFTVKHEERSEDNDSSRLFLIVKMLVHGYGGNLTKARV